jgi:hypothetical protein
MSDTDSARDATATIQGYMFQFDSTILSLCALPDSAVLDIEGIEDFDITTSDISDLFQCKYYEATRLTPAIIRDAILPMIKGYLKLRDQDRHGRRFHLYGYFKNSTPGESSLTLDKLKGVLVRRETRTTRAGKQYVTVDIQQEICATDDELTAFAKQLTIHITGKADHHRRETIEALRRLCGVTPVEAELYVYPTARTLISTMACEPSQLNRRLSRDAFVEQISPSKALFNHWSLRERGERAYCSDMRREYFSERNVDAMQRVFIVDATLQFNDGVLLSLCHTLRRKWSSHAVRRKPDSERYAPTLFVRNLPDTRLVALKTTLRDGGVRFVDGFPFLGSPFTPDHLFTPQTFANQISLRILSSHDELSKALNSIKGQRIVYDFYASRAMAPLPNCQWVSLPTTNVRAIENII